MWCRLTGTIGTTGMLVQEYLETLVALCAACVASIESNFNDRFENAALDMVKTLAADSCEAVEAVQEVVHSAHKGLVQQRAAAPLAHVAQPLLSSLVSRGPLCGYSPSAS